MVSVTSNLIRGPSRMGIATSGPGRRNIVILRLSITRNSVNHIVNGRNEVTGTVHAMVHTTTDGTGVGITIRVSWATSVGSTWALAAAPALLKMFVWLGGFVIGG